MRGRYSWRRHVKRVDHLGSEHRISPTPAPDAKSPSSCQGEEEEGRPSPHSTHCISLCLFDLNGLSGRCVRVGGSVKNYCLSVCLSGNHGAFFAAWRQALCEEGSLRRIRPCCCDRALRCGGMRPGQRRRLRITGGFGPRPRDGPAAAPGCFFSGARLRLLRCLWSPEPSGVLSFFTEPLFVAPWWPRGE